MSPILFYAPGSCAFGSIVALQWLGQPYRLSRLAKEMHGSPVYRRLNPLGEVPALVLGGRVLTESFAILHHIGARDLGRGLSHAQGTPAYDRLNQVLSYLTSSFHPGFQPMFHADRLAGPGEAAREAVLDAGVARLPDRYARVEAMIGDGGWLAGDRATVADAYFYGLARWGDALIDTGAFPRVARLRERLAADPAVRFAHAVEEGRDARPDGAFEGHVAVEEVEERGRAAARRTPWMEAAAC